MTEPETAKRLEFNTELDEAPDKVWRAITEPDLMARWLPELVAANDAKPAIAAEPVFTEEGEQIHYRWHDVGLPEFDTFVVFDIRAREGGGTHLRITHEMQPVELRRTDIRAANANDTPLMRAA